MTSSIQEADDDNPYDQFDPPLSEINGVKPVSFKETLVGNGGMNIDGSPSLEIQEGDVTITHEPYGPSVILS